MTINIPDHGLCDHTTRKELGFSVDYIKYWRGILFTPQVTPCHLGDNTTGSGKISHAQVPRP